ncbi:MAG: class I SAM-dependent methyltransferase [Gammaproteobacteria bacterium]|nr:class I SAM-dependent methyltransferase [Gammaproteobacteria bacterium]
MNDSTAIVESREDAAVAVNADAPVNYDHLSQGYNAYRRPDARIAAMIREALGEVRTVLNIGAGTGAYEPLDIDVVAVDASHGMLSRRINRDHVVQARAEWLPFADNTFDAALGVLTLHHWSDWQAGLREAQRVARRKVVLLTWSAASPRFWLTDYIPEVGTIDQHLFPEPGEIQSVLGAIDVREVRIPHDCTDGFQCAYWARPERYLEPGVRAAISTFARIPEPTAGLQRLADDITSGAWRQRYGHLLTETTQDFGYRLVTAEISHAPT